MAAIDITGSGETARRVKTGVVLAVPVLFFIIGPPWLTQSVVAVFAAMALAELAVMRTRRVGGAAIVLPWMAYVLAASACLALLRTRFGPGALLFALIIAFAGDTGAYLGGRRYGRHKLWPAISPGKTWEGAACGLLGSLLAVPIAELGLFTQIGWSRGALVALGGGVVGQLGDLAESKLKRHFEVKDSGGLLPGHGGFLDRMDAGMPIAILTFAVLSWTH